MTTNRGDNQHRRTTVPQPDTSLWSHSTLSVAAAGSVLGLALVILATVGARGRAHFSDQLVWLEVALTGGAVAAVAQGSVLLRGRRTLGLARREALAIAGQTSLGAAPVPTDARPRVLAPTAQARVTVRGGSRVHRDDCILVRGKTALPAGQGSMAQACEVCEP